MVEDKIMEIATRQEVIAVKDVVLYPRVIIPLLIGRNKSILALEEAMKDDKVLVFMAQKNAEQENPTSNDLYQVGTACLILQFLRLPDNTHRVVVQGLSRVAVKKFLKKEPYFFAQVEELEDIIPVQDPDIQMLMNVVVNQFKQSIDLGKALPPELFIAITNIKEAGHLADLVAFHMHINTEERQAILEAVDLKKRLKLVIEAQAKELEMLRLESKIQFKAREKLDKHQKEYILREHMKAIQEELGSLDEEKEEAKFIREEIEKAGMPQEAKKVALKELGRLERMPAAAAERTVVRTYLDWLLDIPWKKKTKDRLDLGRALKILNEDHYGLNDVKERILEFLAVRKLAGECQKGPILCFVGPPGVGKTSLGRSIARALNRKFIRISLGGIRDEAEIRGFRRTYVGALPGRIVQAMCQTGSKNPLFMMDEIDKIGVDFRGDPSAALLEALDPEQNNSFKDHYLEVPYDLSEVMFILTGNIMDTVPHALRDRMEVIHIPGYTEEEKIHIAMDFLIPKQLTANGLVKNDLGLTEKAVRKIIREYTREAGIRNLERNISSIGRKTARAIVEKKKPLRVVDEADIHGFLKVPKFCYGTPEGESAVGAVKGLAWTEYGGEVMTVEASIFKGKGNLELTGHLGEVMKESAKAALSCIRSYCQREKLAFNFYKNDLHIHVPEGAIPKDGPSAGITMATALCSAITGKAVRGDLAMTGEITLRGRVLPVGGLKEKILAAHRFGILTIVIPEENRKNLEELPDLVIKEMTFFFAKNMDEVLALAFKEKKTGGMRRKTVGVSSKKSRKA
ncbi:MAG: endopeptidase La [bacterium]